jgi:molybdopterin/thiamine biosynthesis adenylyltransferase/TusA-related sulfurtransferase
VGGLGCPAALALARSGAVRLGLFDGDRVESSNLPRQLLYREGDLGRWKVDAAVERLRALAPGCKSEPFAGMAAERLDDLRRFDLWIDGLDRFAAKTWLADRAVAAQRTLIHAGATRLQGQVLEIGPDGQPCLHCLLDGDREIEDSCQQLGILGPVAGTLGGFAARMALDVLAGVGMPGRFIAVDTERGEIREGRFSVEKTCHHGARALDATSDVTADVCPLAFIRARLALEPLPPGGRLGVRLLGEEALRSLPRSFSEEGHRVVSLEAEPGGRHLMILEKRDPSRDAGRSPAATAEPPPPQHPPST